MKRTTTKPEPVKRAAPAPAPAPAAKRPATHPAYGGKAPRSCVFQRVPVVDVILAKRKEVRQGKTAYRRLSDDAHDIVDAFASGGLADLDLEVTEKTQALYLMLGLFNSLVCVRAPRALTAGFSGADPIPIAGTEFMSTRVTNAANDYIGARLKDEATRQGMMDVLESYSFRRARTIEDVRNIMRDKFSDGDTRNRMTALMMEFVYEAMSSTDDDEDGCAESEGDLLD